LPATSIPSPYATPFRSSGSVPLVSSSRLLPLHARRKAQGLGLHRATWRPRCIPEGRHIETMVLTTTQRHVCRLIAENRMASGERSEEHTSELQSRVDLV